MSKEVDQENVTKAVQTSDLLLQDLQSIVRSDNLLLADIAIELLEQSVKLQQRLNRLGSIL